MNSLTSSSRTSKQETKKEVNLNDEYKQKLKADFLEANELLRHFWGTFPLSDRKKIKKAKRLEGILGAYYTSLENKRSQMVQSLNPQEKEYGTHLLSIAKSVHKAIEKYLEIQNKKNGKI